MFARRSFSVVARLAVVLAVVSLVACADAATAPSPVPASTKAFRDTVVGDTTGPCRSGWTIVLGHWVCRDEL